MTERFEVTTGIQKALSMKSEVFGMLLMALHQNPHQQRECSPFVKNRFRKTLVRPAWFLDTNQQGEGIVDVTTHLVDLVQWEAFPGQIIDQSDIKIISSKRWTTSLAPDQFKNITGLANYPEYLEKM